MAVTAPSGMTATPASSTAITLHWTNGQVYDQVWLFRKVTGGAWSKIQPLGGTVTGVSNTGLTGGIEYNYRVLGYYNEENSDYSNTAIARTPLPAPSSCEAYCSGSGEATIEWNDNSSAESGFKVYKDGTYMVTVGANVELYVKTG